MKRKLALALVLSMTLTAVAGCGGTAEETAVSGETAADQTAGGQEETPAGEETARR